MFDGGWEGEGGGWGGWKRTELTGSFCPSLQEWIVTDYNLFEPGQALKDNTVWMLDQMPGKIHAADVTRELLGSQGYVPSYNIPYFPDIFAISEYAELLTLRGVYVLLSINPSLHPFSFVVDTGSTALCMRTTHARASSGATSLACTICSPCRRC